MTASVVGLISPIWLAFEADSVNQMLPSGPAVIPTGQLSDEMGKSVVSPVAGSNSPT